MPLEVKAGQVKWADNALTTTTNQASQPVILRGSKLSWQAIISGTGTVSVTATPQWSNDGTNWIPSSSALSLTGTTTDTKGVTLDSAFRYHRVVLTSITGTGATVTLYAAGNAA